MTDRGATDGRPWWEGAVVYQIYPRSFCLGDPAGRTERLGTARAGPAAPDRLVTGAGDLDGIRRHLDHVAALGADAIWLSPIFPSPMADFGYDVSDYCDIDPVFGDLAAFDALLAEAHERNLRVLLDWVPNHTSSVHRWFQEARSSRDNPRRDWYVWRDPDPGNPSRPPNNWRRAWGDLPAWTFDEETGQWYLHLFLPDQPDLNWANPEVEAAMFAVLDFWLDRGVDGFRIDVVHALGKPAGLPDVAAEQAAIPYSALNDDPATHPILRRLRAHVDTREQRPVLVGEVFLLDAAKVATYYGDDDELHLAFNFTPTFSPFAAASFRRRFEEIEAQHRPRGATPTFVLSNHDRPRHRTRYAGSERRARAAALMALSARGTVFLYAGEELGLEDAPIPAELVVDPGGRDGCRAPIPWEAEPPHGWALGAADPWLPFAPEPDRRNAATEAADDRSILALYRRLGAARREHAALRHGDLTVCDAGDEEVLALARRSGDSRTMTLVNFADRQAELAGDRLWDGDAVVLVASAGDGGRYADGDRFNGKLGPEEAVILLIAPDV